MQEPAHPCLLMAGGVQGMPPGWGMALHVLPQGWLSPKAVSNKRFPVVASTGCLEGGK